MKLLYIESKLKNLELNLPINEIKKLPRRLFLAYSIQYKDLAKSMKILLESNNIKITNFKQVLGCSKIKTKEPVLLIGTGRFHATNLYLQAPEIYLLENNKIIRVNGEEIERLKIQRKSALMKFLNAEKIGILVSTKLGQENLKQAITLKEKLKKKGKQAYVFMSNNINIGELENFNIDSWINTACPGLALDSNNIVNIHEIKI
ncbi:MAG: diphthamide synthesis protein [Candidatus Nanoarchaeia archaeon]|nr:diphthamide synthesis protein [Candidatus Nanoarchaeia archaeon]